MGAVILIAAISAHLILAHLQQESEERAATLTQNLTRSVDQTIDGLIDTIDVALLSSSDEIRRQMAAGTVDGQSITRFLVRQKERLHHVAYLRVMNERGEVIYGPDIPTPPVNNSDREFYIRLRDDPNAGLFVARPVIGRIAQKWLWPFSRRIDKPDGSFGGIVVAAIYVDELEKLLAQIKLAPGDIISIRDAELGLIARSAFDGASTLPPGDKRLSTTFKEALKANPRQGTFVSDETTPDGVSRTYSYWRNPDYGYTINVGLARAPMLAEWRYQTWIAGAVVGTLSLVLLSFSLLIGRAWRRQEQQLSGQEANRESLYEAQRIANLGSYAYDMGTDRWTSSDILDGILGIGSDYPRDFQHWLDLVAVDLRQEMQAYFQDDVLALRRPFDREYRIVRPSDGQERWVYGQGKLKFDARGKPVALHGAIQDITEGKLLEQEREQYFRFFSLSTDAMCIADPFGCFKRVNPALIQLLGFDENELLSKPFLDFILAEDRQRTADEMKLQVAVRPSMHFENRFVCKDGRVITLSWMAYFDKSDGVTYATARDMTELRQAEEMLDRFFTLVPDLMCIASIDGYFLKFNPIWQTMLGYSEEEIAATPYINFVHPDDRRQTTEAVSKQVAGQAVLNFVNRFRCRDGSYRWLEWRTTPAINNAVVYATARDITERETITAELKRSNAELEQFSYAISHDMRQPLRMISSYMQLLETALAGQFDGEQREYFDFAIDGAKRLDRMLVELLEYSRVGRLGEPPAWVDSRSILDDALLILQSDVAETQARISVDGDWPRVCVSRDEIQRLMQNLIDNALKFRVAGRTPEIAITSAIVSRSAGEMPALPCHWRLSVSDNGVGIIPDQISRLFQVFQRLQSRAKYEGTGVGLALCRKIAEHHGGRIWAESPGENQGSTFRVELPIVFPATEPDRPTNHE